MGSAVPRPRPVAVGVRQGRVGFGRNGRQIAGVGLGDVFVRRAHRGALLIDVGVAEIGLRQGAADRLGLRRRRAQRAANRRDHRSTAPIPARNATRCQTLNTVHRSLFGTPANSTPIRPLDNADTSPPRTHARGADLARRADTIPGELRNSSLLQAIGRGRLALASIPRAKRQRFQPSVANMRHLPEIAPDINALAARKAMAARSHYRDGGRAKLRPAPPVRTRSSARGGTPRSSPRAFRTACAG